MDDILWYKDALMPIQNQETIEKMAFGVRKGKISTPIYQQQKVSKTVLDQAISLQDQLVLPGLIDPHVHARDLDQKYKEDYQSFSRAALKGGVTTIFDMPNTKPAIVDVGSFKLKRKMMQQNMAVDYGIYFGASSLDNTSEFEAIQSQSVALKIFLNRSTGQMLIEDESLLEKIFQYWNGIIALHVEGDLIKKALILGEKYQKILYFCHISDAQEMAILINEKKKLQDHYRQTPFYIEVTPHHLLLNQESIHNERDRLLLMMKPNLKSKYDNQILLEAIVNGWVDTIGTDHAPHLIEEKMQKITYGIPSIEWYASLMLELVCRGDISLHRFIALTSKNASEIFKLTNKGGLEENCDADFVVFSQGEYSFSEDRIQTKAKFNPYGNFKFHYQVEQTFLRGNPSYQHYQYHLISGKEVSYAL